MSGISNKLGHCPLCKRHAPLTFHHLIPKKLHRRKHFRKHYTRDELNQGIEICRRCHSGIHKLYSEMELAKQFNTFENLANDPAIQKHCRWVSKQMINIET